MDFGIDDGDDNDMESDNGSDSSKQPQLGCFWSRTFLKYVEVVIIVISYVVLVLCSNAS